MTILTIDPNRRTNAQLIADAAALGWLPEPVFDATYGQGAFWAGYQPGTLITNDIDPSISSHLAHDWTKPFPDDLHGRYGAAVFDPPYKLQGTPSAEFDKMNRAYGVDTPRTMAAVLAMIQAGAIHCAELVCPGGYLLIKVMDQVACGRQIEQTDLVKTTVRAMPRWTYQGHLILTSSPRPQRSQVRPRNNYSTLLAFRRSTRP